MSSNPSESLEYRALLKNSLLELKALQLKLDALEYAMHEPIAVIGLGCRFPGGAHSPALYWQLLKDGTDGITPVPKDRWAIDAFYDAELETPGKMVTRYGGFLPAVDHFDADFFGISPREAVSIDPQQRLLLEVSWEALEDAGQAPDKLNGSQTGVFMGVSTNDYSQLSIATGNLAQIDAYYGTGNAVSVIPGRLSYLLGLQGPSMAIDTACSSSLVAVHLACQSLRREECRLALAGGVNLILTPEVTISFSKARMMAPDGRCKTFAAAADGYVRGEGCGVVVLKRLSAAMADNDRILAVIRGSAVNQDGRSAGLTAPNGPAQQAVIRQALAAAGVAPHEISYVETHGTGTPLGDPIEVQALAEVLGQGRPAGQPVTIASVKTNIGHLEAAAGMASLIKAILALQYGEIPPHLHFHEPSPHIDWQTLPVRVPTSHGPWPAGAGQRLAGVSAFGFMGTNAHVVVGEAPSPAPIAALVADVVDRPAHLLVLSAASEAALVEQAGRYADYLAAHPAEALADVCYSANSGRARLAHRLAIVAASNSQLHEQLALYAAGEKTAGIVGERPVFAGKEEIAFLFTGQGAQYAGMGRELYATSPTFRTALDECAALLAAELETPLLEVLFGQRGELLDETVYTQPALFALEYALAQLWRSWGVTPDLVLGHSVGEYVAAVVAGVFSLADGLKLITARSRLMQGLAEWGEMAAVWAGEAQVTPHLAAYAGRLAIAAVNGPQSVVISGAREAITAVRAVLEQEGLRSQPLAVSHAFHSPLMEPMLAAFAQVAAQVAYHSPAVAFVSNLTGRLVRGEEASQAEYWVRHVRQPVRFA
ncbi:MAG: type I polyketide synthase, partial [Chloroflexi bacterium]|nr:type I polyketide synthase [Chloroflexota bacterium]MCI0643468.1 type I polyketide synthase [Chloroflexota bacterium]MCI0732044.1 type I polyketide synthase [Chloroflexota bacterium]